MGFTKELDLELAEKLVEEAILEYGATHVYEEGTKLYEDGMTGVEKEISAGCLYVHLSESGELSPGCLVGTALIKGGIPMQTFLDLDINVDTDSNAAISTLVSHGHLRATAAAMSFLGCVQAEQDAGNEWGVALQNAHDATEPWKPRD